MLYLSTASAAGGSMGEGEGGSKGWGIVARIVQLGVTQSFAANPKNS